MENTTNRGQNKNYLLQPKKPEIIPTFELTLSTLNWIVQNTICRCRAEWIYHNSNRRKGFDFLAQVWCIKMASMNDPISRRRTKCSHHNPKIAKFRIPTSKSNTLRCYLWELPQKNAQMICLSHYEISNG